MWIPPPDSLCPRGEFSQPHARPHFRPTLQCDAHLIWYFISILAQYFELQDMTSMATAIEKYNDVTTFSKSFYDIKEYFMNHVFHKICKMSHLKVENTFSFLFLNYWHFVDFRLFKEPANLNNIQGQIRNLTPATMVCHQQWKFWNHEFFLYAEILKMHIL